MILSFRAVQLVTYIIVDWFLFTVRLVLLIRIGYKICPRLLAFLIQKQLENCVRPMPAAVEAGGTKTAMRTIQAFMVLLEGDTLTINFLSFMLWIVWFYAVDFDPMIMHVCPLGVWVVFVLFAMD